MQSEHLERYRGKWMTPIQIRADHAFTCVECAALVLAANIGAHEQWHEKMRRAVDETETLG